MRMLSTDSMLNSSRFGLLLLLQLHQAEIGRIDLVSAGHQHGAFHGVFEFAHIARPRILHQRLQRPLSRSPDRTRDSARHSA